MLLQELLWSGCTPATTAAPFCAATPSQDRQQVYQPAHDVPQVVVDHHHVELVAGGDLLLGGPDPAGELQKPRKPGKKAECCAVVSR